MSKKIKKEKQYRAVVRVGWECVFSEPNKKEAVEYLIDNFQDEYGIEITKKEIISLKEDK